MDFELVPPDAGSQSDSYSDGLLARVAGRDDCAFINLGAYNLFRLQRLIRGERRLITFLDEYDPVIELNEPLLAAVEVLLEQIDRPENTPEQSNIIEEEFVTVPEFKSRTGCERRLRERFF